MSDPQDEDPANGPGVLVLIVVLIIFAFGCAWLFTKLKSANEELTCLASGRRNCDQIQQ
jgi:hypothetical protein